MRDRTYSSLSIHSESFKLYSSLIHIIRYFLTIDSINYHQDDFFWSFISVLTSVISTSERRDKIKMMLIRRRRQSWLSFRSFLSLSLTFLRKSFSSSFTSFFFFRITHKGWIFPCRSDLNLILWRILFQNISSTSAISSEIFFVQIINFSI